MARYTMPKLSPPKILLGRIPKGYAGTQRTVAHIRNLILEGAKNFYVRQKAIDILLEKGVQPKDYEREIEALFQWVQRNVRYTKDPFRVEVLHTPQRLLELRAGDCDDMTILLSAMLESIGHPTRLVLVGPDPSRPDLFSHVYLEANHQGQWIPLDPTMPYPMGWAPPRLVKRVFPLERSSAMLAQDELQGLGAAQAAPAELHGLILAVRGQAIQPKDARVRSLWDTLRRRQLLSRSLWLRELLRRIWVRGLAPRPRPKTAQRMARLLGRWNILPGAGQSRMATAPLPGARLRPMRPLAVRTVRPVQVRPVATAKKVAARNPRARSVNGLEPAL